MPQGSPLRVPTPQGILLFDPLSDEQGGMLPTAQNILTRYGALRSRTGLVRLGQELGELVLGGWYVRDKTGTVQLVIATPTHWWLFNNATRQWTALTGAVAGPPQGPVTFTYWEEGDNQYVLGVNDADVAQEWQVGAAGIAPIATGYIARSICTVANRVFYGNVSITGVRYPTMVAWSAVGTRGTNPALARTKLIDSGDHIVAVRRSTRLTVVIYREQTIYVGQAVEGSDAGAFQFTIAAQQPGPLGPMAVADDPAFEHVYLATDLNLWHFDGVTASILAYTSDFLSNRVSALTAPLTNVVFDQVAQEFLVSMALDGDALPSHAFSYSSLTKGVFPLVWNRLYPVTTTITWQSQLETVTHQLPDVPTHQLPDVPTHQLGYQPGQEIVLVGTDGSVNMYQGPDDRGAGIPCQAEFLMPTTPGLEYEFDGVEIQATTTTGPITVYVGVGHVYDQLTWHLLGEIEPGQTAPEYPAPLRDVPGGPNLSRVRSNSVLRGRFVVVRLLAQSPGPVRIRRIELLTWQRRVMA